jgi:hypothetical protein
MKKTTKKTSPSKAAPAPAPKAVKAPAKKVTAPAKKVTAPAKKKTGEPPATFISAQIDIGFGNHLFIRGEGPGLSWSHGLAMDCSGAGLWTTNVKNASAPVVFKVLVNDLSWSTGNDFVAAPGQSLTITPSF